MKTIWKFPIQITDVQVLMMPRGAEILCAQVQSSSIQNNTNIYLWALVSSVAEPVQRRIAVIGTGHPVPANTLGYIGTVQTMGGALVWHIFELL